MSERRWTPEQLPDLAGRRIVITGAASGIGLAAARVLAARGAELVVGEVALERARAAIDFPADLRRLDLADPASIREFAAGLPGPIDALVNNAGIMGVPLERTRGGIERHLAVNHLGHFALTGRLLDRIVGRVVTVSSDAHRFGRLRLDDPGAERGYLPLLAYADSKLANLLFAGELARRLQAAGSTVRSIAVHPGFVDTPIQARSGRPLQDRAARLLVRLAAQSAQQGAWPILYALAADLPSDACIGPDGPLGLRGHPVAARRARRARDRRLAEQLWALSEQLTGLRYQLPSPD